LQPIAAVLVPDWHETCYLHPSPGGTEIPDSLWVFSNVSNVSVLYYDGNEMHSEQFIVVDLLCGIFIYIYILMDYITMFAVINIKKMWVSS
jgi:hypothetical protein